MIGKSFEKNYHPFMIKKYWPHLTALFAGMFYATGFPMFGDYTFILGPIFAFFLLNWSLEQRTNLKTQLIFAWLFSFGFYSVGYYWIPFLLKEFGGLYPPFNYLLGLIFSFILLPQTYVYVFIKRRFNNIFLLSFTYAMFEFFIPQQFPSHLGHTFISLAPKFNLNLASIFGAPIYSFLVCLISLSALEHIQTKKIPIPYYLTILILLIASFLPLNFKQRNQKQLFVRIVQPNIGNFIKVDSERGGKDSMKNVMESYFDLSTAPSIKPLELIIWPETAFPNLLSSKVLSLTKDENTPPIIKQIIQKTQSEMLIGGYDFNNESKSNYGFETDFNTAFYFSNKAELKDSYHKMKLIPFGEGLPFGPFNQFLSKYITNVSFFAKGDRATLFTLPNGMHFSTAICYEILFPSFIRDLLNSNNAEADFIINLTNDSWYGDTFEPYQHLFLSKWRALEFNIPIIRSTNTGITTIIYPNGSESKRMMINEKSYMDIDFNFSEHTKTLYQRFGIFGFILFGIILSYLEKILLLKDRVNE